MMFDFESVSNKQRSLKFKLKFSTLKEEDQGLVTFPPPVQGEPECYKEYQEENCRDDPVHSLLSSKGIGSI